MKFSLIALASAAVASVTAAPTLHNKRANTNTAPLSKADSGATTDGRIGAAYTGTLSSPAQGADILIRGGGFTNRLEDFNVTISYDTKVRRSPPSSRLLLPADALVVTGW
jgi:hypothetical protein